MYTGSIGFGDKYIDKLTGRVGTLDVSDCMATVEELVRLGISEHGRQLVHGSSHGGFIAGHLIGQYSDVFKAAVMVNAVTSLGEFVASSDEPDFPFVEMGIPYPPGTCMTPEIYQVFYEASPIAHTGPFARWRGRPSCPTNSRKELLPCSQGPGQTSGHAYFP